MTDLPTVYIELNKCASLMRAESMIEARGYVDLAMLVVWSMMDEVERDALVATLGLYMEPSFGH